MKKIVFSCLTIFVFLLFIELTLNIAAFSFYRPQHGQNFLKDEHKNMFRILTLGESTTAPLYRDGVDISWPAELERKLKQNGLKIKIFNEGKSGITSSHVVENLVQSIDYYKPNLIIAMTGINDLNNLYYDQNSQSSLLDLKTFKLLRWINSATKEYFKQTLSSQQWKSELTKAKSAVEKIKNSSSVSLDIDILQIIKKSLIPETIMAQIYWDIVALKTQNDLNKYEIILRELSLYASTNYPDSLEAVNMRLDYLSRQDNMTECRKYSKYIVNQVELDAETQTRLSYCYRFEDEALSKLLPATFKTMGQKKKNANRETILNLAAQRKIPVILMQYPTLPLQDLENGLTHDSNTFFIENNINFQEAMAQNGYDYVFFDRFKKTWGHCTLEGNKLIVDNLLVTVKKLMINH